MTFDKYLIAHNKSVTANGDTRYNQNIVDNRKDGNERVANIIKNIHVLYGTDDSDAAHTTTINNNDIYNANNVYNEHYVYYKYCIIDALFIS